MSVTLQVRLNGGAPQTGGVTGALGDSVQLTAADKGNWSGAARWEIYDYPSTFTVPAGWSTDANGVFYVLGNADPPSFTISGATRWGKYAFRVTAIDGGAPTVDEATALSIPSANGLKSVFSGETSQFGGERGRWVKDLQHDLRTLESISGGGGSGTVTPDPSTIAERGAAGELYATAFVGPAAADVVVEAQSGYSCSFNAPTANYKFSDTTTSAYPTVLVCDGTQSFITCSSTSGFRYRAAEHTFSNTTASAITGSLTVELRSGEMRIEGKGASKPVELHAPSGQPLRLASLGGSRMRLGASGIIALDRWDGAAWEQEGSIQATATTVDLYGASGTSRATVKANDDVELYTDGGPVLLLSPASGTASTTVGTATLTLTESDSSGTYLLAANAPMRVQPETPGAGAGRAVTVLAGSGASGSAPADATIEGGTAIGGNQAGGKVRLVGGTPSGSGAAGNIVFVFGGTERLSVQNIAGVGVTLLGTGILDLATVGVAQLRGLSGTRIDATTLTRRDENGANLWNEAKGSAAIASATTTNVVTFATTSNRVYQCVGHLTVSNDTDNEGAAYMVRAAFKNVGGTVTQIGSTQAIAADLEDAGQTGLAAVLDFSGTDIRLRLTTDSGDTVNVNGVLKAFERVLA